jgi:hypothetical protein
MPRAKLELGAVEGETLTVAPLRLSRVRVTEPERQLPAGGMKELESVRVEPMSGRYSPLKGCGSA